MCGFRVHFYVAIHFPVIPFPNMLFIHLFEQWPNNMTNKSLDINIRFIETKRPTVMFIA